MKKRDSAWYQTNAETLKAIAHPTRLAILEGLLENECNVNVIQDCLELPQSTVSQHLKILRMAGLVQGRKEGLNICYRVTDQRVRSLIKTLTQP